MKLKRLLALLLAFAMLTAACGGGDDEATDAGDTTETTAAGSESTDSSAEESTDSTEDEGAMDEVDPASITTDYGVTDDTIRVGMNADLSGIFAPLVTQVVEAQKVYFDKLNEEGGIAGRQIEYVVIDNAYDVPTHIENYAELAQENDEGVVMISQSTGSPHTSAVEKQADEDNMIMLPLSWYSGWADADFGAVAIETYTNYCVESMNGLTFLRDKLEEEGKDLTLAVLSFPGEYGQDGATGAKKAAEALGFEVVYDGEAAVVPDADKTPVISELVNSDANAVWATINPTTLAEIMGGAVAEGFDGYWSGNSPTFNYQLLGTELGSALDQYYFHSTYTALWESNDSPGMTEMVEAMKAGRPDLPVSDAYILGWTEAQATEAILRKAAENGDMTRAGVRAASQEVTVDFDGLAPTQTWGGDPNDYIVRESYIYDVSQADFNYVNLSEDGGSTGLVPIDGYAPFTSDVAAEFNYEGPCFAPQG